MGGQVVDSQFFQRETSHNKDLDTEVRLNTKQKDSNSCPLKSESETFSTTYNMK